jgi:hypothetical protein
MIEEDGILWELLMNKKVQDIQEGNRREEGDARGKS